MIRTSEGSSTRWPLPVCILAGGFATRLGQVTRTTPKALVPIGGQPFIHYQLRLLAEQGTRNIVLCVGHLGHLVERELGHEQFGVTISYSYDRPGTDGTLGAIRRAQPLLGSRFFYLYGDTILKLNYPSVEQSWRDSSKPAIMTVLRNAGRWGTSNVDFEHGLVVCYEKVSPRPDMQWVDYGMGGLSAEALELAPPEARDLSSLHTVLAANGQLCGYEVTERFYEIGTPAALEETRRHLAAEKPSANEPSQSQR